MDGSVAYLGSAIFLRWTCVFIFANTNLNPVRLFTVLIFIKLVFRGHCTRGKTSSFIDLYKLSVLTSYLEACFNGLWLRQRCPNILMTYLERWETFGSKRVKERRHFLGHYFVRTRETGSRVSKNEIGRKLWTRQFKLTCVNFSPFW